MRKTKSPETMPMYAANLVKCKTKYIMPELWQDEFGAWWHSKDPVWYYDLYYVGSGRKYDGIQCLQARNKRDAIKKIKLLWRVTEVR